MEYYTELLKQANEHLRATDSKRDRMFYLYVVMFGLYLNFFKDMLLNTAICNLAGTFLVLLGICIIFMIINYQVWHLVYLNTAVILQRILARGIQQQSNETTIQNAINELQRKQINKVGYGASFFLFNSILLINCAVITLTSYQLTKGSGNTNWISLLIPSLVVYILAFNYYYTRRIANAMKKIHALSWMLSN